MWVTIALATAAAIITAGVLTVIRGAEQNQSELQTAVSSAASIAAASVNDSLSALESLREGGAFTPELISEISALGASSRGLVESAGALPTDGSSLAEVRLSATALAGRISRLGETFGATFSYRGQIAPNLMPPTLTDPLEIANLADNTALLAGWQNRLEQAAASPPSQPRLLQNHQALEATLPYLAVHLESYADAVQNGRPEQASAALGQVASLLLAIGQDLDQAVSEITEIAEVEIRSLATDPSESGSWYLKDLTGHQHLGVQSIQLHQFLYDFAEIHALGREPIGNLPKGVSGRDHYRLRLLLTHGADRFLFKHHKQPAGDRHDQESQEKSP